jgi:hypothetical protein
MKITLPSSFSFKNPVFIRFAALFILLWVSFQLLVQQSTTFSFTAWINSTPLNYEKGAGIWMLISLVFSITLNYIIRRGEKTPDKVAIKEKTASSDRTFKTSFSEKPGAFKTTSVSDTIALPGNVHHKQPHLMQPNVAMHLIKSSRHKVRVAS